MRASQNPPHLPRFSTQALCFKRTMTQLLPEKISLKHRVEYLLFSWLKKRVLNASENKLKIYQGAIFGVLKLFRVKQNVMKTNLRIAFPHLNEKEQTKLITANYQWAAQVTVAILRMAYWKKKTAHYVTFHQISDLDEALSENKGVLLISGHLGHWEIIVPALVERGYQMYMYTGRQKNPLVDQFHNDNQTEFGTQIIRKGDSARFQFMRILKAQNILAMNVDQNDHKSETFVNFFGKLATLPKSVAGFHMSRKSPIVLAFGIFAGERLEIYFQRLHHAPTGEKEKDLMAITQKISDITEAFVRQYPEQYFWMHRRWKTRPPSDAEPVY